MFRRFAFIALFIFTSQTVFAQTAGQVVDFVKVKDFSIQEINMYKQQLGITTPTTTSVSMYKLHYYTTDLDGKFVVASAGVAVPNETPVDQRPILSYQHGTIARRVDAPSMNFNEVMVNGAIYTSNGFIVVAADYLGLGDNIAFHPYLHADTEATACADALLAIYSLNLSTSKKLFLAGYSQGGHATVALHRYWQAMYGALHPVTAAAPMAGPYDLSGSVVATATETTKISKNSPMYTGYLVFSMNTIYHLAPDLSGMILAPYDKTIPTLFDGTHPSAEVESQLPTTLTALLKPDFIVSVLKQTDDPFLIALRKQDVYDWKPDAPVQFCQGDADLDVPTSNTTIVMARMSALGATVTRAVIPTGLTHATAVMPCFRASAQFIEGLR